MSILFHVRIRQIRISSLCKRLLHIPAYSEMLVNSGIQSCRCVVDFNILTQRYIQKFRDLFYRIGILNPYIVVWSDPVKFILSVSIDLCCLGQADLSAVHIDPQGIAQFRKLSNLQHCRFSFGGRSDHDTVSVMYPGIHVRFVPVDPDHCCLSLLAPHHPCFAIDRKQQGFSFSGEQLIVGELHLHGGIRH